MQATRYASNKQQDIQQQDIQATIYIYYYYIIIILLLLFLFIILIIINYLELCSLYNSKPVLRMF